MNFIVGTPSHPLTLNGSTYDKCRERCFKEQIHSTKYVESKLRSLGANLPFQDQISVTMVTVDQIRNYS